TAIIFMFETLRSYSKLLKTFTGHTNCVNAIDYFEFGDCKLICSGSDDKIVRVWNIENNKQIQLFDDIKIRQLQVFKEQCVPVRRMEFSTFNCDRYLCSVSLDKTIRLLDAEAFKILHIFNGHEGGVRSIDISPLHINYKNKNKNNSVGVIGGNGYKIFSGSDDKTIRIWYIETTKQLNVFKGHDMVVKIQYYLAHGISVRLWDTRSGPQIQVFNGHITHLNVVDYAPFVIDNIEINNISSVICSGSWDNTIRFWDIRSNKKELYVMKESDHNGILYLKFITIRNNDCFYFDIFNFFKGQQKKV
ncbi:hypothetical protein RFI_34943, partial [Reticulomyxa filosa]